MSFIRKHLRIAEFGKFDKITKANLAKNIREVKFSGAEKTELTKIFVRLDEVEKKINFLRSKGIPSEIINKIINLEKHLGLDFAKIEKENEAIVKNIRFANRVLEDIESLLRVKTAQ